MTPTQPTALEGVKLPVEVQVLGDGDDSRFDKGALIFSGNWLVADCQTEQIAHAIAHALNSQGELKNALRRISLGNDAATMREWATDALRSAIQGAKG